MSIQLSCPESEDLECDKVMPHKIEAAKKFSEDREAKLQAVRDQFQINLKQYMDREDLLWKKVQVVFTDLKSNIQDLQKNASNNSDQAVSISLNAKNDKLNEEIAVITNNLEKFSQKKESDENLLRSMEQNKAQLIESLDSKILKRYDTPRLTNKSGEVYNWILGCLYNSKKNIIDFCEQEKIMLKQKPPPPPQPQKSSGFSICGKAKQFVHHVALEEPWDEVDAAWAGFTNFVYKDDGADFAKRLKEFNPLSLKPIQVMLTEELINEKKEILKAIFEIDIKDQVRMLIEIVENIHNLYSSQKQQNKNANEKNDTKLAFAQLKQKQSEQQQMKQQIEMIEKRQKCVRKLSEVTTEILRYLTTKSSDMDDKIQNNDKETNDINMSIMNLQNNLQMELYKVQEEQQQVLEKQAAIERDKLLKEQQRELEKQKLEMEQQKIREQQEKNQANAGRQQQEEEEQQQAEEDHPDEVQDKYDSDNDDEEVEHNLIPPSDDPMMLNIQKTMYPHLLKTEQNAKKQKKGGGSIFSTVLQGKKK